MSAFRPRVAALTTVWRHNSHADVIIPKLLAGYDVDGSAVRPAVDVVSLFVDQLPENDLSRRWAARFGVPVFPTVGEAMTVGGAALAVDAVLIVGEHGEYPWNAQGQHLYPRRELFEQATSVVAGSGRPVPLFNDKHLSYSWDHATWMIDEAHRLGLPFMAGSSLPVTWRDPLLSIPLEAPVEEALVLSHGPAESYGFHALETLQCMVERRRGGETGVAAVELLHGAAFWAAWEAGRFPRDLYAAALATTRHGAGDLPAFFAPPSSAATAAMPGVPGPHPPLAFVVEYRDGLRATLLNLAGYVSDFAFAARLAAGAGASGAGTAGAGTAGERVASAFKLEGGPPRWHFNLLTQHVEAFFRTGQAPYPVERTLLTTGILAALMDAGAAGTRLETPHLDLRYQAPRVEARYANGVSLAPEAVWGFTPEDV